MKKITINFHKGGYYEGNMAVASSSFSFCGLWNTFPPLQPVFLGELFIEEQGSVPVEIDIVE